LKPSPYFFVWSAFRIHIAFLASLEGNLIGYLLLSSPSQLFLLENLSYIDTSTINEISFKNDKGAEEFCIAVA